LLITDFAGPARALADRSRRVEWLGSMADGGPQGLAGAGAVASDGRRFAVRFLDGVTWASPGDFSLGPTCTSVGFFVGYPVGVHGDTLAWVQQGAHGPYFLRLATAGVSACTSSDVVEFSQVPLAATAVGLIDDRYALVVSRWYANLVDVTIEDRVTLGPRGATLANVDVGFLSSEHRSVGAFRRSAAPRGEQQTAQRTADHVHGSLNAAACPSLPVPPPPEHERTAKPAMNARASLSSLEIR
jgi:hypothetical protein